MEDINGFVAEVGFPVLVRPSYVLSGAAMNVCSNQEELERFLKLAANVSQKHPVVVSQFIEHAKEVEMDAVADHGEIVMYAISEHTRSPRRSSMSRQCVASSASVSRSPRS